jgi:hypothetical protein
LREEEVLEANWTDGNDGERLINELVWTLVVVLKG